MSMQLVTDGDNFWTVDTIVLSPQLGRQRLVCNNVVGWD
jgi:hypothetical protein